MTYNNVFYIPEIQNSQLSLSKMLRSNVLTNSTCIVRYFIQFHVKRNLLYYMYVKPIIESKRIGNLGEDIAVRFLEKRGYSVIERNYLRKVGEIDVICQKGEVVYFVEVKTVSRETVSRETADTFRPEDNLHKNKLLRLERTINMYIEDRNIENDWEVMAVIVTIDTISKIARVKLLKDFAW